MGTGKKIWYDRRKYYGNKFLNFEKSERRGENIDFERKREYTISMLYTRYNIMYALYTSRRREDSIRGKYDGEDGTGSFGED